MIPNPSLVVKIGIPALALAVAALFVVAAWASTRRGDPSRTGRDVVRAALGAAGFLAVSGALAASGVLAQVDVMPPPLMPMMLVLLGTTAATALSPLGRRIATSVPLWALVGSQGFRFPLELVMRQAAHDGVMPVAMSFEGSNFDVVTGITALLLGAALYRGHVPRAVVLVWNVGGLLLLANIVGIAIAALPFIAAFGPAQVNTWIMYFPYVWLPAILVPGALFGHLVVFRRLRAERGGPQGISYEESSSTA